MLLGGLAAMGAGAVLAVVAIGAPLLVAGALLAGLVVWWLARRAR